MQIRRRCKASASRCIGYGSQGRAQALNLRDSGLDVVLGQRPGGPSGKKAEQDGWKLLSAAEATKGADIVIMLSPDMTQPAIYRDSVAPNMKDGAMLLFSHGFNIHYGQITSAEEYRRDHDRAESSRRSRPPPV